MRAARSLLLLLVTAVQVIGAFLHYPLQGKSMTVKPSTSSLGLRHAAARMIRNSRSRPMGGCRMATVGEEEAIKSVQAWDGAPSDCHLVCSPSASDAGVMAAFLREVMEGSKGKTFLIAPNCDSSSDHDAMERMAEYLNSICPWAHVKDLGCSAFTTLSPLEGVEAIRAGVWTPFQDFLGKLYAIKGAPQPCLSYSTSDRPEYEASPQSTKDLSNDRVMSKVLDWFTAMLIDLDDEEEYVAIGRSLLSVQRYVVTPAHTVPSMAEVFWKEVESLAEQSQEGNIIIVMPDFLIENPDEFETFAKNNLGVPLQWGAGTSRQLEVSAYHPKGPREKMRSPWPLLQISLFDPAPPRAPTDLTAEDEVTFGDEMDTVRISTDKLREASGKKLSSSESMPGFPLKLDELLGEPEK